MGAKDGRAGSRAEHRQGAAAGCRQRKSRHGARHCDWPRQADLLCLLAVGLARDELEQEPPPEQSNNQLRSLEGSSRRVAAGQPDHSWRRWQQLCLAVQLLFKNVPGGEAGVSYGGEAIHQRASHEGLHARYILDCDRRIPGIARVSTTTGYHVVSTTTGTKSPRTTEPTDRRNQKPI